jgi:PAS domain S-box-containing protein/excisionase family DNA binding protein
MVTLGNEPAARSSVAAGASERFYSVSEAAARLGVSRISVWRWIRDGRLPAARLGHRTTRISGRDIDRLLAPGVDSPTTAVAVAAKGAPHEAPSGRWWEIDSSEHLVQFYESDGFLIDAVSDFIGSALRSGDGAIVIATPNHVEALNARLTDHGLDIDSAVIRGQYVYLDAGDTLATFMVEGMPDPVRFQQEVGGMVERSLAGWRRVRAFGEMVALLATHDQPTAAVRLEQLWNELQKQHVFSLMCAYPMQLLGGEPMAPFVEEVCRDHSRIVPAESYTALDGSDARLRAIAVLQQRAHSLELEVLARARAEQELRRREAELRDFLDQATLAMHWVDADGKILWANQAELDLLGYAADEYIGHDIAEFYADREVADDVLGRLQRRETIREHEVRLRRKNGAIRHALVSSNVLWDGDTFVHTRCFTVDITRRKLAEQRLALQYAVTQALSESRTLADAGATTLRRVGEALGWQAGGLWLVDQHAAVLRCRDFWRIDDPDIAEFEAISRALALAPGEGLPGSVWSSGQPAWIVDIVGDENFRRTLNALKAGLHGAIAFPVRVDEELVGVVEFFSREIEEPDDEVVAVTAPRRPNWSVGGCARYSNKHRPPWRCCAVHGTCSSSSIPSTSERWAAARPRTLSDWRYAMHCPNWSHRGSSRSSMTCTRRASRLPVPRCESCWIVLTTGSWRRRSSTCSCRPRELNRARWTASSSMRST